MFWKQWNFFPTQKKNTTSFLSPFCLEIRGWTDVASSLLFSVLQGKDCLIGNFFFSCKAPLRGKLIFASRRVVGGVVFLFRAAYVYTPRTFSFSPLDDHISRMQTDPFFFHGSFPPLLEINRCRTTGVAWLFFSPPPTHQGLTKPAPFSPPLFLLDAVTQDSAPLSIRRSKHPFFLLGAAPRKKREGVPLFSLFFPPG